MKEKISNNIQIKNKRATFDYELLDTFTAGIVLTGTEIKSIPFREGEFGIRFVSWKRKGTVGEEYVHRRIFLRYVQ